MEVGGDELVWGWSPLVVVTSHTSLPKSGSERIALLFSAQHKCRHGDYTRWTCEGMSTGHQHRAHAHTHICTHKHSTTP